MFEKERGWGNPTNSKSQKDWYSVVLGSGTHRTFGLKSEVICVPRSQLNTEEWKIRHTSPDSKTSGGTRTLKVQGGLYRNDCTQYTSVLRVSGNIERLRGSCPGDMTRLIHGLRCYGRHCPVNKLSNYCPEIERDLVTGKSTGVYGN